MDENSDHSWRPTAAEGRGPSSIVKVGGSLLDLPDLPIRLLDLLSQFESTPALVIGGGAAADAVRGWSGVFGLSDSVAHWLAVDALSLTARLVCGLLNREAAGDGAATKAAQVVDSWPDARLTVERGMIPVLDPRGLLRSVAENPGIELPESWAATSDSIAAAIAIRWDVPQLVLAKSVDAPPEPGADSGRSADSPIDDWFEHLARQLRIVQWCNLRASTVRCQPWRAV